MITKDQVDKKVLEQTWCPFKDCGSSDAFTIYETSDGKHNAYCYSCGKSTNDPYGDMKKYISSSDDPKAGSLNPEVHSVKGSKDYYNVPQSTAGTITVSIEEGLQHPIRALPERMLSFQTCEHFNVRIGVSPVDGETPIYTLFPLYRNEELVDWLIKDQSKKFLTNGSNGLDLFGSNKLKPNGKKLWITTGLEDAMSIYQVLKESSTIPDWEPQVVSITNGDRSAVKAISRQIDLISSFEEVILVFDNDSSGKQARDEVCKLLAGKVSYVTLPLKDANEMLKANRGNELKWLCLTGQRKYHPDGIVNAKDLWERYKEEDKTVYFPYPKTMSKLNESTCGVRPGSIVTVTAGTGSGKTQFLRELIYHFSQTTEEKIAGMFLEEDISDTLRGLISLDLNKRIHLPNVTVDPSEEANSFNKLFGSGRISLYDYFGGMDDGSLLNKLRYFASTGHKFIFLDHLSIVVSEYAAEGGERERIDTLMTKLAKFVKEFKIVLFLVVHLRKSDNSRTSFELGAKPSLDDLRGSGSLKQLSWDVIGLSRNQQHEDKYCANTTEVSVLKCRFTGRTGTCDYLHFDDNTGRLYDVKEPLGYRSKKKVEFSSDSEF